MLEGLQGWLSLGNRARRVQRIADRRRPAGAKRQITVSEAPYVILCNNLLPLRGFTMIDKPS